MKIRKKIDLSVKKYCEEKHVYLLSIGEKEKRQYVLIKDYNIFMYNHTFHRGRKHFYCYCFQAFNTEEILKNRIKDCFNINCKQIIVMSKKREYVKFMKCERKIKSPFAIYADFENMLVPEDNGKRN